ncbi:hypothetical protein G7Y89_g12847 [Cudoniella acicularis]|uniref:Polyketide synthase n=1 Tax=Cudoniella acicularis TaxID=354080 RepID=A0A8H4VZ93_9HELO|nr:hypothetical protein G7Y89_g12847 [Cudoniella acicularis]
MTASQPQDMPWSTKLFGETLNNTSNLLAILQSYKKSSPQNLSIIVLLNLLSAYLQIVTIYDKLLQCLCKQLSSSSPSQILPGLQLAGFSVQQSNLQTKLLMDVMLHQLAAMEQVLGLPISSTEPFGIIIANELLFFPYVFGASDTFRHQLVQGSELKQVPPHHSPITMSNHQNEPIAVVGSACRFAGDASSPSKLWDILQNPTDLRQEIPPSRFNPGAFYHPDGSHHGHSNVRHAYLLNEDLAAFDAEFFGIKPVEAKAIDPQQRFLLEIVYEGLESAGIPISELRGSDTGVYVGVMFNDYGTMLLRDYQDVPTYYATGTGQSILSNRISYFFDWHGPSVTLDTACSSSLVAVHMAVQALRSGDSRMALACGTNLIIGPEGFIIESKLSMLSPDGRSRMWDQGANGYARGDGVAAVVLKTLSAALEDGDYIECIIRETGLNQDGATPGITMPSATAQEALIRSTYAKAGLNLLAPNDRPQYFEAHGTGTPAGDPTEAEAVYNAFYVSRRGNVLPHPRTLGGGHPLYVGSIKTIMGHTEGTAGVAALIKVSLALQEGIIPPNLLFEQLSERVAPFYKNVEILRTAKPWPSVEGQKRRASVNSFGFGGANAHAIVESYDNTQTGPHSLAPTFTPFVFSALSEFSLRESLSAYAAFLESVQDYNAGVHPQDLAWTLRQRCSVFPYRISFPGSSLKELQAKIAAKLEDKENPSIGIKALSSIPSQRGSGGRILGIFTGQGAQYARMGAELIEQSSTARKIIQELESYLAQIPEEKDRPSWSLETELLADASSSRVNEAALSQPLCTALQILLIDLLSLAGVHFSAIVGHSSGEIAAAYAAGYLSARDAMWIAYYRGLHSSLAASPNGSDIKGAMLAVGTSMEDMTELCADESFAGRVTVAASNSLSSVTVSGDEDAIAELELVLEDEAKFYRRLKVDKAYHSRHMLPCFEPYIASMRSIGIEPQTPSGHPCVWFSSVYDGRPIDADMVQGLGNTYWGENLTKPVLFSEAVSSALNADSYALALEVGPHPALKVPATETIKEFVELPYHGVLSRGSSAIDASSAALGFLWSYLDKTNIDLDKYERAMTGVDAGHQFHLVKGLPTYRWNHETKFWHEARSSRKMRLRTHPVHPLLGDITSDSAPHHMSWRNLLRVSEMEWLSGHAVQNQIVFPAAGYLASALEASRFVAEKTGKDIRLVETHDFAIHQAVAFEKDDTSIEVLIEMAEITRDQRRQPIDVIRARFTYSAALDPRADDLTLAASGDVVIHLGETSLSLLPARGPPLPHMIDAEQGRFYSALADLGYNFQGRFRAMEELRRKRGKSTCLVKMQPAEDSLLIHPAELDAVLQSAILAYSYPYDEELRTLHLPTTIRQIRINPAALLDGAASRGSKDELVPVDASIDFGKKAGAGIVANINLYATSTTTRPNAAVQVQGVAFMPLGGSAAEEDRRMYSKVHWIPDRPDGIEAARDLWEGNNQRETVQLLERIATFYLRKFDQEIPPDHSARITFPTKWYLNHARHVKEVVASGKHKWWKDEWHNDTLDKILEVSRPYMHLPDVEIMHLVGTQMPRVFAGETTMLEEFRAGGNDVLDRYYAEGIGLRELAKWVGRAVKQIVDRHPHMNVLEVGAGTGGATKAIFREIGDSFLSYTYTDISAAFFENASGVFSQQKNKMVFKTLDVEKEPVEQDFTEGAYDLVIAFFVIHATSDLERSLRNMRKLLKPGGFLIVGEGSETGTGAATSGFIFGTLPGWWIGTDKGRALSPLVSPKQWDNLLRTTGFSGADTAPPISVEDIFNVFPVVSQAVDDYVNFLREPLALGSSLETAGVPLIKKLILIGGETARSLHIIEGLEATLGRDIATEFHYFRALTDVDFELVDDSTVISLTELDSPVFKDITSERFDALKKIFEPGKTVLWVTSGRLCDEPYTNMTVAFGRVATHETPDLHLQQLDIPDPEKTSPRTVAEAFLRFYAAFSKKDNHNIFWTIEPEIVIDNKERQLVPRLGFIAELNDRYNAGRRPVVREVNIKESPVPITVQPNQGGGYVLKELSRYETELSQYSDDSEDFIELRTTHAVLSALKTPFGHKFLILGEQSETGVLYMTLVPSLASVLKVSSKSVMHCEIPGFSNENTLRSIAAHLVSMTMLDPLYSGETLVTHNAPRIIVEALTVQAIAKGVHVIYTTDSDDEEVPDSWVKLPRYLSQFDLDEILVLAESTAAFVGLSNHKIEISENEATIVSSLDAQYHTVMTAKSIYSTIASAGSSPAAGLEDMLCKAFTYVQQQWNLDTKERPFSSFPATEDVRLDDLAGGSCPLDPLSIINWTDATLLPVYATRLDAGPMFKSTGSTYWIVGMSGALGISLADWMISKGARNLVMTSRKPDIAPEWIASHKRKGATVTIIPCDVTNEIALKAAHQNICDSLPPIVGVINGAMVLHDISIRNMSFKELTNVIRPKVDGSIYLDRIFWDVDLDFFVLTSSINTVIGNLGQANYAAANAFMCSLAAHRRKRGFRAAAVNGGAIIGAGYMEREARRAWDRIAQNNYMMCLSEEDFVQSICEAIDGSRLDSLQGPEISTGLNNVPSDAANQPFWSPDPKFSIFMVHRQVGAEIEGQGKAAAADASVEDLLQKCKSQQEVHDVIKHAFAATLRAILQVNMSDDDLMATNSSEIGLDSLVSVNIRSWFLKHLQVGIPVLKIMGNDTMGNLVRLAVNTMPPELVPQLYASTAVEEDADAGQKSSASDSGLESLSSAPTRPDMTPMTDVELDFPHETTKINDAVTTGIDWEAESRVPADLAEIPLAADLPTPITPPKVIVLTGAGGLLGHHLLEHLLEHTSAQKIICIAIRNLATRLKKGELPPPGPRVEYHEGDLSAPLLGLTPAEATLIFDTADAVIHNGADTSHLKGYMDLRASNVGSTMTLTRLCLPRRVPLHYVSSAGLAILYDQEAFPPVSVTGPECALPASDGSFGYASAKWTCERFLEQTHALYGGAWRVCIHRPSTIIREGADARGEKAKLDWVNAMMYYARKSKSVPRVHRNRGALDLVYVQNACADLIAHVVNDDERMKRGAVSYVHQVGDKIIPLDRLQDIGLQEAEGRPFDLLPMGEWIAKAVADGLHPAVAVLVEMMDEPGGPDYPRLLKDAPIS